MLPGTPPKVEGVIVAVSWTNAAPRLMVSWEAVTYSSAVTYNVYYTNMSQDQPVSTNTASADGLSAIFAEGIQACTTYYIWVSAISISMLLEGPFGDRTTTDTFESENVHVYKICIILYGLQHLQIYNASCYVMFMFYSSSPGRYSNSYQNC